MYCASERFDRGERVLGEQLLPLLLTAVASGFGASMNQRQPSHDVGASVTAITAAAARAFQRPMRRCVSTVAA